MINGLALRLHRSSRYGLPRTEHSTVLLAIHHDHGCCSDNRWRPYKRSGHGKRTHGSCANGPMQEVSANLRLRNTVAVMYSES
jgi:hypothetical protein